MQVLTITIAVASCSLNILTQTVLGFMKITVSSLHLLIRLILNLPVLADTVPINTSPHDAAQAVDLTSVPNTAICLENRFGNLEEGTEKGVSI